ncbi:MAG: phage tail assembly chaperone [Pseudomonadota bacterium]
MTDRFAPAAGRLAGAAGRLLGWRPDEFWRCTPAELAAILAPAADAAASASMTTAELASLILQDKDEGTRP